MSAKWERSKAWDDRFFPPWAWPAKRVVRAFSSVTLAVTLLSLVLVYGVLASVPIGLLALIPTRLIDALTFVGVVAAIVVPAVIIVRRLLRRSSPAARFASTFGAILLLGVLGAYLWIALIWPALRYDPVTGAGLRLFGGFVDAYQSTTLRRLPAFEMTEGQFYGWWPLKLVLLLFIINLTFATFRRIEFRFENLGVLTVHTGIIVLAMGSIHYQTLKEEGDVLLLASAEPGAPGPAASSFMDRDLPALWARVDGGSWSVVPMPRLPRYNDFGADLSDRSLDIELPSIPQIAQGSDPISIRIDGFGAYVELVKSWAPAEAGATPATHAGGPLVEIEFLSALPDEQEQPTKQELTRRTIGSFRLPAGSPKDRVIDVGGAMFIEHVPEQDTTRWSALRSPAPSGTTYALVVDDEQGEPHAVAIKPGAVIDADGYSIVVKEIDAKSPFPIITPGYEGANSSVAVLGVTSPTGETFERWVFHRYPELDQDIHGVRSDGRPDRRPADPSLRLALLDASVVQVYIRDGEAIVRMPGGEVRTQPFNVGGEIEIAPMVSLRLARRWLNSAPIETPVVTPPDRQRKDAVGTHDKSAIAVELASGKGWRQTVWLPFTRFMNVDTGSIRTVELPDSRQLRLAFSRQPRPLPGITLQLADFEMIPYPDSDIPSNYLSRLVLTDLVRDRTETYITRLNHPLIHRAPFHKRADRPALANALAAAVNVIAPNRYKFSQAGWDAEGWRQSQAKVDAGQLDRARASFTILGVGNNPGIHIIAAGGVMFALGIPWAFYVKPMLLRRRKRRIQRQLDASRTPGDSQPHTRQAHRSAPRPASQADPVGANS